MNRQLSDANIRATCRELMRTHGRVSGRGLRQALRARYGAVGKTARVFQIWREEAVPKALAAPATAAVAALEARVLAAETAAAANLARAERAEYREQAHQDKWALEIDRLRQALRDQEALARENRHLRDRVAELSRHLIAARQRP